MNRFFLLALCALFAPVSEVLAIANPASQKCISDGGSLDIQTDAQGNQFGQCTFPNGKICEEWDYFNGKCSGKDFSDVPQTHRFAEAISYVQQQGIVQGYADGTYRPETTINRAEFTKIIVESLFSDSQISECDISKYSFPDVATNEWYAPYVCLAKKEGIINGYSDGTFQPSSTITLPEAMKIILEAYNIDLSNYEKSGIAHSEDLVPIAKGAWYGKYMYYFAERIAYPDMMKFPQLQFSDTEIIYNTLEVDQRALVYKISRGEMAYFIKKISEQDTSYIGMTEQEAQKIADAIGSPFRVVERDGQPLPVTMDYRIGRINAVIQSGIVVSYTIEGEEDIIHPIIIPENCTSWFDGCNTCMVSGGKIGGCTKMFCQTESTPYCKAYLQ